MRAGVQGRDVRSLFDLTDKVAIVTGGGSGIGLQLATSLAELGASIVLCARKADRCEAAASDLKAAGVRALGLRCDVTKPDEVEALVTRTVEEFGRIDILVNNSGTTWAAPAEDVPLEGWQKVIDVNLTGLFLVSQAVGRVMIAQGGGKIVNIASIAAFGGHPPELHDAIPYTASKGGVLAFTADLAVKWARHGIAVNAIAPGWFPTDLTNEFLAQRGDLLLERIPLRRFGREDELKGAVAFLASPASDYVTGQTLTVDGGYSA